MPLFAPVDRKPVWLAFLAAFLMLAFFVAPDVGWYDAGELSASIFSVGVSHPTGFPLYHPLGKLASLIPVGSIAFRINLLSALFAAGTVAVLTWLLLAVTRRDGVAGDIDRLPAVAGAMAMLASGTFWLHAVSVEVYVINALALALFLAGLLPLLRGDLGPEGRLEAGRRVVPLLAFGFGLGLGSHVTFPLVAGVASLPLLYLLLSEGRCRRWLLSRLPFLMAVFILGALVIAYLPLVASRDPLRNWGDPITIERLVDHLTGARIRRMFDDEMSRWSWASLMAHAGLYLRLVWSNLGPLLGASAAGALWLGLRHRALLVATGLGLLADAFFTIKLNPMGMAELQTSIPSYLILVLWAGFAVLWAARLLAAAFPRFPGLSAAFVILPVVGLAAPSLLDTEVERDFSEAREAASLVRIAMNNAPPGALWITSSDSLCSLTAHLQAVENHRPDLRALVKQSLWDPFYMGSLVREDRGRVVSAAVVEQQAALVAEGRAFDNEEQKKLLISIVQDYARDGFPVFFEPGDGVLDAPFRPYFTAGFPLWRLGQERSATKELEEFDRRSADVLRLWQQGSGGLRMASGRLAVAHWLRIASAQLARVGNDDAAMALIERAKSLAPQEPRTLNNLAVLLSRRGDFEGAKDAAVEAVAKSPDYGAAWTNLGSFRAVTREREGAYEAFAAATSLGASPRERFRAAFDLGRMHALREEKAMARFWLERALEMTPEHAEARRWLSDL